MMDVPLRARARESELRLVITRADGTCEDLGLVAAHYRNPLRQIWWWCVGRPRSAWRVRAANRAHRTPT